MDGQKYSSHRGSILGRRPCRGKGTEKEGVWLTPGIWDQCGEQSDQIKEC